MQAKIKSKILKNFYHIAEIDLLCYEKINDPEIFNAIENQMQKRVIKESSFIDVWKCCEKKYWKYSALILHIENIHCGYTFKVERNLKRKTYKYICDQCNNIFLDYNTIINHFTRKHVTHQLNCNYCESTYNNIKEFKIHTSRNQCIGIYPPIEWSVTALKGSESD